MKTKGFFFRCTALLFFIFISIEHSGVYAQTDSVPDDKFRRHELGVDVIGLIRMFPNYGTTLDYWSPNYLLTYRYHFKKGNLRMGLGGLGAKDEFKIYSPGMPTDRFASSFMAIDFRIGYEAFTNIGKKWQVFYGVDLRPTFLYSTMEFENGGSNVPHHEDLFAHQYGIAPILGIRFKPAKRISIVLESSVGFNVQFANVRSYNVINGYEVESMTSPRTRFFTSFYQPVSLSCTFDL